MANPKKYIALLRGINVSGQKLIKMKDLKDLMDSQGFDKVATYIQSGNILFESAMVDSVKIGPLIEKAIKNNFGFDVPVIIKTKEEWIEMASKNPFLLKDNLNIDKLYITFLGTNADIDLVKKFTEIDVSPDHLIVDGKLVYGLFPNGYGNSKYNNNYVESKLKVSATTRNWKTYLKLSELLNTL